MRFLKSKYAAFGAFVGTATALGLPAVAGAQTTTTNYDLTPATDGIVSQVTSVLTTVLPIAGGLVALFIGWKILRRMVKA